MLITDDCGAALLVDGLGLEFGSVSLELNALADHDPNLWAIGKLYAYECQRAPFVHIDNDVFLWERLPPELERASVIAQSPEYVPYGGGFYRPESIEYAIHRHGGWMPETFESYMPISGIIKAENCGIMGGCRTDFIRHYASETIRFIEHPDNHAVWRSRPQLDQDMVLFEQLMLSACVAFHHGRPGSPYADISMSYLFSGHEDALERADACGYTHMLASAKRDPDLAAHLERTVSQLYPQSYLRCIENLAARTI
ncbi:hypothetical protein KQ313_11940 [Synechococcus sp. CS-1325]|nr:hypothetical protein [Synechococcus sp. CS-1325]